MEAQVRKQKDRKKNEPSDKIKRYSLILQELLQHTEIDTDDVYEQYRLAYPELYDKELSYKEEKRFKQKVKRDLDDLEYMQIIQQVEDRSAFVLNPKNDEQWNQIRETADIYTATYAIIGMNILRYDFGLPKESLENIVMDDIPFGKTISYMSIPILENISPTKKDNLKRDISSYIDVYIRLKKSGYPRSEIVKELVYMENRIKEKIEFINQLPFNHYKRWNKEDEDELLECIETLACELGRTKKAIMIRILEQLRDHSEEDKL